MFLIIKIKWLEDRENCSWKIFAYTFKEQSDSASHSTVQTVDLRKRNNYFVHYRDDVGQEEGAEKKI